MAENIKKIKKCEDTFCKEYSKKVIKMSKDVIKLVITKSKTKYLDEKLKYLLKIKIKDIQDKLKTKEFKDETKKLCKDSFCNPTCKGTIFQNEKFPKELEEKFIKEKDGKITIEYLKELRKKIFKDKKSIIKDGFYTEFKDTQKIKKKGAISACAIASLI